MPKYLLQRKMPEKNYSMNNIAMFARITDNIVFNEEMCWHDVPLEKILFSIFEAEFGLEIKEKDGKTYWRASKANAWKNTMGMITSVSDYFEFESDEIALLWFKLEYGG